LLENKHVGAARFHSPQEMENVGRTARVSGIHSIEHSARIMDHSDFVLMHKACAQALAEVRLGAPGDLANDPGSSFVAHLKFAGDPCWEAIRPPRATTMADVTDQRHSRVLDLEGTRRPGGLIVQTAEMLSGRGGSGAADLKPSAVPPTTPT
jgi:hypothetical protein